MESEVKNSVGQEEIHSLLFGDKLSWQSIIYDLINSEQLDPWNIDISLLSAKYLEKIRDLESANFFVSSKVLLAAALLLRIKSEILLNRDIPGLDDILFGKKEEKKYVQERIELDEDVPELIARTPMPRFKKVTLQELMAALGNAIKTENRRIKRIVVAKQYEIEAQVNLPKNRINLRDRIREVYSKLKEVFKNREERLAFSHLIGDKASAEDKIMHFVPLLHLDTQHRVWLEQNGHLEEIYILLKEIYEKKNADELARMQKEVEDEIGEIEGEMKAEEVVEESLEKDEVIYENPFGEKRF